LVAKTTSVLQRQDHNVLHYFKLAMAMGSRSYEPNEGAPFPDRHRHLNFGISLNISEILRNPMFHGSISPCHAAKA